MMSRGNPVGYTMINPELSRRVGRVITVEPIVRFKYPEKEALQRAVVAALTFEDLPLKYQRVIIEAEGNAKRVKG